MRKDRKPAGAPKSADEFQNAAQVATNEVIELNDTQKREYEKLSDNVKASYPLTLINMMQPKDISQLRDDNEAPRGYKAIALQFNRYEYDRLEQASNRAGVSKNKFMRDAVEAACKKILK
jgi:hypothetical protein